MKILTALMGFLGFCVFESSAQNICPQGNFETYSTLPSNYAQICYASGWLNPNNSCSLIPGTGSPDYYSLLGSGGAKAPTTWWANVSPHGGNGFIGFATWYSSANYREYAYTTLSSPMVPGALYQVSFWITNGVSTLHYWGSNNIGCYFSTAAVSQTLGSPITSVIPQVETTSVIYSTTWTQVTFQFVPAAAYTYLTIGNFHNDAATSRTLFGPNNPSSYGAYYYLDDVSVQMISPLPVELVSFSGKNIQGKNNLSWTTASEINNDHFDVERSSDAVNFETIGRVIGNGNSTTIIDYAFTDEQPLNGKNYYRLNQFDYDGAQTHSETIVLNTESNRFDFLGLDIRPGSGTGSLILNLPDAAEVNLRIYSSLGSLIASQHFNAGSGYQLLTFDMGQIPAQGIYFACLESDGSMEVRKVEF